MEKLGINFGFIIVQIINFAIIFIVLRKWAFIPILDMLDSRKETLAQGIEDAREAAEARANAEKDADTIKAEAQAQAAGTVREATQRAEQAAKDVKAAAEADAKTARDKALAGVEEERDRILGDVRGQVAALAMAATQKLLGEALDEKKQRALIDEFFSGIKGGKVTIVDAATSEAAQVTSALPLTDKEKKELQGTLSGDVQFKVDPNILGGLIVRVGDKVMDGSVSGKLDTMRQNLQ